LADRLSESWASCQLWSYTVGRIIWPYRAYIYRRRRPCLALSKACWSLSYRSIFWFLFLL